MENRDIYALMDRFEQSSLSVMELEQAGTRLLLKKGTPAVEAARKPAAEKQESLQEPEKEAAALAEVKAPLVGVFYAAPSPEDEPFVRVGDRVSKGQVLCLLEAMKMMNELKSPFDGIIRKILPENGKPVEFNQTIFEVEEC